jgi:serine phosphatase RsbU (regulator of sigma subunit)
LHQANQTLWAGSAGDQQAAALVAFLRPNDGRLQYSAAGPIRAIVVDRQGSAATKTATACLGEVPESRYPAGELDLQPGQVAVLFTEPHDTAGVRLSEMDIAGVLLPHLAEPARQLAQLLRECLTTAGERPLAEDCTVVVLKRGSAHG